MNGWPTNRTVILIAPRYLITEMVKTDGTKVIFDKPLFMIETEDYGDGSGRKAPKIR